MAQRENGKQVGTTCGVSGEQEKDTKVEDTRHSQIMN